MELPGKGKGADLANSIFSSETSESMHVLNILLLFRQSFFSLSDILAVRQAEVTQSHKKNSIMFCIPLGNICCFVCLFLT